MAFWVIWLFLIVGHFTRLGQMGFFLPFIFFFPFFRRGRRNRPSPVPSGGPGKEGDDFDYTFENLLLDENKKAPRSWEHIIMYAAAAVVVAIGIVLLLMHYGVL